MSLFLAHPEIANRSCDECCKWYFDDSGRIKMRGGEPLKRVPGEKPGCWKCPKCSGLPSADQTPERGRQMELSERNRRALRFYYEVKACGGEVDSIARRNCGIIESVITRLRVSIDAEVMKGIGMMV